jgi:hypothetical protein
MWQTAQQVRACAGAAGADRHRGAQKQNPARLSCWRGGGVGWVVRGPRRQPPRDEQNVDPAPPSIDTMPPLLRGLRLTFHPQHALGRSCRRAFLVCIVAIAVHHTHPSAKRAWEWSLKTVQLFLLWCGIIGVRRWGPHDPTPPFFLFFFLLITLELEGVFKRI